MILEVAHPQSGSSSTWFLVELEFENDGPDHFSLRPRILFFLWCKWDLRVSVHGLFQHFIKRLVMLDCHCHLQHTRKLF